MTTTTLRAWIEERLEGRSWNWLGRQLADDVTGAAVRNWADGRYPLKAYRAQQIATVLGGDAAEIMRMGEEAFAAFQGTAAQVRGPVGAGRNREQLLEVLRDSDAFGGLDDLPTESLRELVRILGLALVDGGEESPPNGRTGTVD